MSFQILKWVGTASIILAAVCRSFDYHMADIVLSIIGAGIWGYAAYVMKDKALLTVNGFILAILTYGAIR